MNKWIKASERLPVAGKLVVFKSNGMYFTGEYWDEDVCRFIDVKDGTFCIKDVEWLEETEEPETKIEDNDIPLYLNKEFSTKDILGFLIKGCEYLLNNKNYDGGDYEEISLCVKEGKKLITALESKPIADNVSEEEHKDFIHYVITENHFVGSAVNMPLIVQAETFEELKKGMYELFESYKEILSKTQLVFEQKETL